MPKGGSKLKASLSAHQARSAHKAADAARAANKAALAGAPRRSAGDKKADKRRRARQREAEQATAEDDARRRAARMAAELNDDDDDAMDAADDDEAAQLARTVAEATRATMPIAFDDTVLLLGEANFSFARALVTRGHSGHLVCATAYDSERETLDKYPDAADNVSWLRARGVRVAFGVDAGALEKSKDVGKGRRWSRVVFNFPHTGKGITDQDRNVRGNQEMLLRTFKSVSSVLTDGPSAFPIVEVKGKGGKKRTKIVLRGKANNKPKRARTPDSGDEADEGDDNDDLDDGGGMPTPAPASFTPPLREGTLLVTLLDQAPYSLWDVKALATRPPPACPGTGGRVACKKYRLLRSFEFVPAAWPGYAHRRTVGWREGLSKDANEEIVGRIGKARTWEFAAVEEEEEFRKDAGWGGRLGTL